MPCDLIYQQNLAAAERERKEREREEALTQIEQDLGAGIAAIVQNPDGSYSLEGTPLPEGMYDSCVLAALQERGSMEFMNACAAAGANVFDFIGAHNASHQ